MLHIKIFSYTVIESFLFSGEKETLNVGETYLFSTLHFNSNIGIILCLIIAATKCKRLINSFIHIYVYTGREESSLASLDAPLPYIIYNKRK